MHIRTVILLRNFSFGLINFVNLSTMFFIQGFFTFFIIFIKNAFLMFFILEVNFFYIYGSDWLMVNQKKMQGVDRSRAVLH